MDKPRRKDLIGHRQYRIIPSRFPPINVLESLVSADDLEVLYAIESLTNDRLQAELGNLHLLPKSHWVTGPGATVVMAAFTHIGNKSRFSNGDYGVYYAGLDEDTAIAETVFHNERRLRATQEPPIELDMRVYVGTVARRLEDLRPARWQRYQQPALSTWPSAQRFAAERRDDGCDGFVYRSARRDGGECVAAFVPGAVSLPRQGKHLRYVWDGEQVSHVFSVGRLRRW
ncbi:MAG: RES family NAD+ phosphorylase [Pseudomonadota bacterium]